MADPTSWLVTTAALLAACGGKAFEAGGESGGSSAGGTSTGTGGIWVTGGASGSGGSGFPLGGSSSGGATSTGGATSSGGATSTGGAPPLHCDVDVDDFPEQPPYAIRFVLANPGEVPLYLYEECQLRHEIRSCAESYSRALQTSAFCSSPCSDSSGGCVVCGPCNAAPVLVEPGGSVELSWEGSVYTSGTDANGCICHEQYAAHTGVYRIEIPVYETEGAAELGESVYVVKHEFDLPSWPSAAVEVSLLAPSP